MAEDITADIANEEARHTNPLKDCLKQPAKQPKIDFSLQQADWARG
jgi:hypothetical protein